jgi:hypothetical protein
MFDKEVLSAIEEIITAFGPLLGPPLGFGLGVLVLQIIWRSIRGVDSQPTSTTKYTEAQRLPVSPPPPLPTPKYQPHTRVVVSQWEMLVLFAMDNFFSNCKHCGARFPLGSTSCQQCGAPRK